MVRVEGYGHGETRLYSAFVSRVFKVDILEGLRAEVGVVMIKSNVSRVQTASYTCWYMPLLMLNTFTSHYETKAVIYCLSNAKSFLDECVLL